MNNMGSHTCYKSLLRRSQELCDLCERTFKNRFQSIVHNAAHIIIPLIKQNWYQCDQCLYYLPSKVELHEHHEAKHTEISNNNTQVGNENKFSSKIKFEYSDDIDKNDGFQIESEFNDTTNNINVENNVETTEWNLNIKQEPTQMEEFACNNRELIIANGDTERISNGKPGSIKNRLIFESDDDLPITYLNKDRCTVQMLKKPLDKMSRLKKISKQNDLAINETVSNATNSCAQKRSLHNKTVISIKLPKNTDVCNNTVHDNFVVSTEQKVKKHNVDEFIVNKSQMATPIHSNIVQNISEDVPEVPEPIYKSIHYIELIKPGIFKCKYCQASFPNRLHLIQHEPKHMHVRRPRPILCTYCDKYIAGNYIQLRWHIQSKHVGAQIDQRHNTHRCQKCGLKFRKYSNHVKNYHPYECPECGKEYGENEANQLVEHVQNCTNVVSSKMMNVCDMCYDFSKDKMNLKYTLMGTTENVPGVRHQCSVCGKKCFVLKTVRRVLYGCNSNVRSYCRNRKPMSNEDRLKKFQHRLKRINSLNKFYYEVLFSYLVEKKFCMTNISM